MVDPQAQLLRPGELTFMIQVGVELGITQGRLERLDIFPVRPAQHLLHLRQGSAHLGRKKRERLQVTCAGQGRRPPASSGTAVSDTPFPPTTAEPPPPRLLKSPERGWTV